MTDFAPLLARRPRPEGARRSTSSTRTASPAGPRPRRADDRALLDAHRFDGKTGYACVILPARRRVRGGRRGRQCRRAVALVPGQARRDACPRAPIAWPTASRARRRSAGCSPSIASTATARRTPSRGPRVLLTGEPARIDETVAAGRGDRPGPRPRQHARRRPRPGRARGGRARRWPSAFGGEVRVTAGDALAEGYPMIAAVGARRRARARAAPDRARMGRPEPSARRDRRQGRLLRHAAGSTSSPPAACG